MTQIPDDLPAIEAFDALLTEVFALAEIVLGDPDRYDDLIRARARRRLRALLRALDATNTKQ